MKSIWLFPAIVTMLLLLATAFKISGSSIGIYNEFLNGTKNDSNVLLNKPRAIRSDEWVVNSQMIIAQDRAGYPLVNKNIGDGQDMSVIIDVPYKEWSAAFKPQNLAFFILPFDNAFAFKWWVMGYLLVLSVYFFVITLLPRRRLLASALAVAFFFSAFVQWWYQYITLAPLFYCLFMATAFIYLTRVKRRRHKLAIGAALSYLLVCFALVIYPPFQIPCALALAAFSTGIFIEWARRQTKKAIMEFVAIGGGALVVAGLLIGLFLTTRSTTIHTIQNTVYPGKRIVKSGGFDTYHTFSGNLGFQFQYDKKALAYQIPKNGLTNQSESSNFLLLQPLLFVPSIYLSVLLWRRKKRIDWPVTGVNAMFLVFLGWLYVPHLPLIGTLLQLNKVPLPRVLIGLGLVSIMQAVLFIRQSEPFKKNPFSNRMIYVYCWLLFVFEIGLGLHAMHSFTGFIGQYRVIAFALPLPIVVLCLLKRRYSLGILGYALFSVFISIGVNPLYRGTAVLTSTPIANEIHRIDTAEPGRWVSEDSYLENMPILSGASSLTGIYSYPQLQLWDPIDKGQSAIYNRYAHVNFVIDRRSPNGKPSFIQTTPDHFGVLSPVCGDYMQQERVEYIVTSVEIASNCTEPVSDVAYPNAHFYIYRYTY